MIEGIFQSPVTALMLTVVLFHVGLCDVYHIQASSNQTCPTKPCLTLSQFSTYKLIRYVTNVTLVFLPGNHSLQSKLYIENLMMFSMVAFSGHFSSCKSEVAILCGSQGRFEIVGVNTVQVNCLKFNGCSKNKVKTVNQFTLEDSSFVGSQENIGTAIEVDESSANFVRSSFSYNKGNTKMIDCIVDLHGSIIIKVITVYCAGAIAIRHSVVTIEQSVFKGNSANIGGALYIESHSTVTVISSTFVENHSSTLDSVMYSILFCGHEKFAASGGAIYADRATKITIFGSTFSRNKAAEYGGALYVEVDDEYDSFTMVINECKFVDNMATGTSADGGAIKIHSVYSANSVVIVNITDSKFVNNAAMVNSGGVSIAISNQANVKFHLTITSSTFSHHSALAGGGGALRLHVHSNTNYKTSAISIRLIKTEFMNNAASSGGAVNIASSGRTPTTVDLSMIEVKCVGNHASDDGGVLTLNVMNSHIMKLRATITDSEFINNSAQEYGGVVHIASRTPGNNWDSKVIMNSSKFINNTAKHGGVLFCTQDSSFCKDIVVDATTFINNSARVDGGVFYLNRFTHTKIMMSKFIGNRATGGDGGVFFTEDSSIVIIKSLFNENAADTNGGTMYSNGGTTSISDSKFYRNEAGDSGGVLASLSVELNITTSNFTYNRVHSNGRGGVLHVQTGALTISNSQFSHSRANFGGVIWAQEETIKCYNATRFENNSANTDGGVLYTEHTITNIIGASFRNNSADNNGGTMFIDGGETSLINSHFSENTAGHDGGVLRSYLINQTTIDECDFIDNRAKSNGGVLSAKQSTVRINKSLFTGSAAYTGGAIQVDQGKLTLTKTSFTNNNASAGSVLLAKKAKIRGSVIDISQNHGKFGVVYLLTSKMYLSSLMFLDNEGSLFARASHLEFDGVSKMLNNVQPSKWTTINRVQEGGAITAALRSVILFRGSIELRNNTAERGGAINAIKSKIHIHGKTTVADNRATEFGGGINLYHSEVTCKKDSTLALSRNDGSEKGGAVMALSSSIVMKVDKTHNKITVNENKAKKGGGLYFQMDTKLLILKSKPNVSRHEIITFSANSADYGGALYVSDDGICGLSIIDECSIQALALYSPVSPDHDSSNTRSKNTIIFSNNTAELSGHGLFGGLWDRCTVSIFAEPNINKVNMDYSLSNSTIITEGLDYLQMISNVNKSDVSSDPVRVCFCIGGQPDCSYHPDSMSIQRGKQKNITLSVAVVDQVGNPLQEAKIYSHFGSGNYLCQNHVQTMDGSCSKVDFAVGSDNDTEELILSLGEGPCEHAEESQARITLEFICLQCPIGFELESTVTGCRCVCDSQLVPYFTDCSKDVLIRDKNVWISSINVSDISDRYHYLIHPFCPLNYCHPPSSRVKINLNVQDGADAQCADNRSGLLCGTCQIGFSLSLGSSRCISCPNNWPLILVTVIVVTIFLGMLLVVLLLALNMTVAVGTLNGIIFYANIVNANKSILLPFSTPNFATVFVSWLNLDIGIDACFFEGMDTFWKTLLQFAFPAYVIILVVMVIAISEYSRKFAQLIGKRNPIATLATLILFSYAKLLHNIIASISCAILEYPDGSKQRVWLHDASVLYLHGKHLALFSIAVVVLVAGVVYTVILAFWQWFLRLSDKKAFSFVKYQKLCHFIEPYHAPYSFSHRYWTGLLLLVRVILYIVFASNINGDHQLSLVATIFSVTLLLLVKGIFASKLYRKWPVDVLELIMYFNIIAFAALIWYSGDSVEMQTSVAYTSVTITFTLLVVVIAFHVHKYTCLSFIIQKKQIYKMIKNKLKTKQPEQKAPTDNAVDFSAEITSLPTQSVVEFHIPHL